jgi:hypothetical protein
MAIDESIPLATPSKTCYTDLIFIIGDPTERQQARPSDTAGRFDPGADQNQRGSRPSCALYCSLNPGGTPRIA